ncbi:MAG TPA: formylglycine-generating enzyme family protein [Pseudomonadota bacterium]|nr:formylglycine-generating enzyme family protein [Pseudomonadota bacterium]
MQRQRLWHALLLALSISVGFLADVARSAAGPATPPIAGRMPDEVTVAAGEFWYGDDGGEEDERPARRLQLATFYIDHTEVTVAAYARCVAAGRCRAVASAAKEGRFPVVGVSFDDAAAYCAFVGRRLPTEQEWEKAARGVDARTFPWGNEFSCLRGNFGNFGGDGRCAEDGAPGAPVAVGSFGSGASPYGALDMAGNVWEWVDGRYGYTPDRGGTSPTAELRVIRGGGCCSILGLPRVSNRLALPKSYHDVDIGFRCARSAAPAPQPPTGQATPRSDGGR